MITPTRTIAIEVFDLYAVCLQVKAGRRVWLDGAGRTDVVRSYRVAKDSQWSRNGKRHDQRRAHQEVGFDTLMNACFKVSIAGENTGRDQIVITKDLFDVWIEWSRITDTSCATITHQIEPQLVEIFLQASLLKIFSYHSRAGRQ